MRYSCDFQHSDTGERKTIVAALSAAECESIESLRKHKGAETATVTAEAMALRKAYAEVPHNFQHTAVPLLVS